MRTLFVLLLGAALGYGFSQWRAIGHELEEGDRKRKPFELHIVREGDEQ